MNTVEDVWKKLASSKKYREEFALSLLKRSVSFQVKTLRKKRCGSQAVLAERAKLTQGVVSRAEDQDYGNLTFNTVGRIAGGLDMAFIGKFVPFSALVRYSLELSEAQFENIPTFDEESLGRVLNPLPTAYHEITRPRQDKPKILVLRQERADYAWSRVAKKNRYGRPRRVA